MWHVTPRNRIVKIDNILNTKSDNDYLGHRRPNKCPSPSLRPNPPIWEKEGEKKKPDLPGRITGVIPQFSKVTAKEKVTDYFGFSQYQNSEELNLKWEIVTQKKNENGHF